MYVLYTIFRLPPHRKGIKILCFNIITLTFLCPRGSFRKKGGIIKPTVTVAVNNLADIDDIDTNTAVDILRRRYLKNIFYVSYNWDYSNN